MRRMLCAVLCLVLLLSLTACPLRGKDGIVFYYPYTDIQYGMEQGVIGSEHRDLTGHENDLSYLITLYLTGPLDVDLASPFPAGTKLLEAVQEDASITVILSILDIQLSDSQYTLACSTLAQTCLALPGVEQVTVISGSRTITVNDQNLAVFDSVDNYANNTEEAQ